MTFFNATAGRTPRVPGWVLALLAVDLLMGVLNVASFAVTRMLNLAPISTFRLSGERNVPTWWSSSQLLIIGIVLAILAYRLWNRRSLASWGIALASAMFLFMSMDETAVLHEAIGHRWGPTSLRTGMWVVLVVPVFLVVLALIARAVWPYLRGRVGVIRGYTAGIALLLFCAVGVELMANLWPDGSVQVNALVIIEEVGEMIAATLILWATVLWLQSFGVGFTFGKPDRLGTKAASSENADAPAVSSVV